MKYDKRLYEGIMDAIRIGIHNALSDNNLNEGKLKNAALGGLMGLSLMGGMQSCSNINPAQQYAYAGKHTRANDYSGREWAYQPFAGTTQKCEMLIGTLDNKYNPYQIKQFVVTQPNNSLYTDTNSELNIHNLPDGKIGSWTTCNWCISYVNTEMRDNYDVEIYHTDGYPLDFTSYDGSFYMEIWFANEDKTLSREERAQFIKIYRSQETKRETEWQVDIASVKAKTDEYYNLSKMGQLH